jgi:COP9 signalosome complex subunit 5
VLCCDQSDKLECELAPDGKTVVSDGDAIARWGGQWNRYYRLDIEYFNSSMATFIMRSLKQRFLWVDDLASTATKTASFSDEFPQRVAKLNKSLTGMASSVGAPKFAGVADAARGGGGGDGGGREDAKTDPVTDALVTSANLARELVTGQLRSVGKSMALS